MHIPDGSNIDYKSKEPVDGLFSWGWLGNNIPTTFDENDVDDMVTKQLLIKELNTLERVNLCRGFHRCEICNDASFCGEYHVEKDGVIYACPSGVQPYIEVHNYKPPQEVIAVLLER